MVPVLAEFDDLQSARQPDECRRREVGQNVHLAKRYDANAILSSTGGATVTTPSAGFSDPDLAVYFTRKAPTSTRTATRDTSSFTNSATSTPAPSRSNAGAIAGGVVGGAVGLGLIVALVFCCLRRRRRQRNTQASHSNNVQYFDHSPPAQHSQPSAYTSPDVKHTRDSNGTFSSSQASPYPQQGSTNWQPMQPQPYYPPPAQAQVSFRRPSSSRVSCHHGMITMLILASSNTTHLPPSPSNLHRTIRWRRCMNYQMYEVQRACRSCVTTHRVSTMGEPVQECGERAQEESTKSDELNC